MLSKDEKILYRYFGDSEYVEIPDRVEYIKGGAFSEKMINEIYIPESVEFIGDNPFAGINLQFYYSGNKQGNKTQKLKVINKSVYFEILGDALYSIIDSRLISCWTHEDNIQIKHGTKIIGKNAFWQSNVECIYFYDSHIEKIDPLEFIRCFKLKNIYVDWSEVDYIKRIFPRHVEDYITELPF